ncbi:MAG TPA: DUF4238 domain-containing protein [Micromonosporaceae bacterium]|jgi:hypothetical protein
MTSPSFDPQTFQARIDELRAEPRGKTARQHVLSQVILRHFTDRSRLVRPISVTDPDAPNRPIGPNGAGWERNFVPYAADSAEKPWGTVEARLRGVISRCVDRTPLSAEDFDVLRATVALHYIRNPKSLPIHRKSYEEARAGVVRRLPSVRGYEAAFQKLYGVLPAGPEASEILMAEFAKQMDDDMVSGLMWRCSAERMFYRCCEILAPMALEIIHPIDDEFLIGDSPVIVTNESLGKGPADHLALGDATQLHMPLAYNLMIAFGPRHVHGDIDAVLVRKLNIQQIQAARKHVFARPNSGLADLVQKTKWPPIDE